MKTQAFPYAKIAPNTYEIGEFDCASMFLLVGDEQAFSEYIREEAQGMIAPGSRPPSDASPEPSSVRPPEGEPDGLPIPGEPNELPLP